MTPDPLTQTLTLRRARDTDAKAVIALLSTNHNVEVAFDPAQFLVAERDGRILACGRLKPLAENVYEIASVVVVQDAQRQGLGARIVEQLLADKQGTVFALALEPGFFRTQGFHEIPAVPPLLVGKATSVCAKSGFVPMRRIQA